MAVAVTNEHLQVDWQLSKECVRDRIKTLLKTSQWSDCTFQVGGRTDFEARHQGYILKLLHFNET
jgi:glutathionylspermidine synthase